jgi:hypothetical protein
MMLRVDHLDAPERRLAHGDLDDALAEGLVGLDRDLHLDRFESLGRIGPLQRFLRGDHIVIGPAGTEIGIDQRLDLGIAEPGDAGHIDRSDHETGRRRARAGALCFRGRRILREHGGNRAHGDQRGDGDHAEERLLHLRSRSGPRRSPGRRRGSC